MKIAQVSPLHESVPPKFYGGTERIVHYLTEELVAAGHDVTLFASGDSVTQASLQAMVPSALRLNPKVIDPLAAHLLMFDRVAAWAERFDIIHFHTDYLHFPVFRGCPVPHLSTFHGRLDIPDLGPVFEAFRELPIVSISNDQRRPVRRANWLGTVYHGLPENLYRYSPRTEGYLAFLGRISKEKRPDRAIEIAIRTGLPLKIAAKVDKADREYFETVIKPWLDHPLVEYLGEIDERDKDRLLGGAEALLFPIDWPEPFGLVMIEAMACGTPVIAFRQGSVPEVIEDGVTGFVVDSIEDAVLAVAKAAQLDRARCRREFERRFSARRMAQDYVALYARLGQRQPGLAVAGGFKPKPRSNGVIVA